MGTYDTCGETQRNKPMTRDEILNATPERLRIWVAVEVMGWTKIESYAADENLWGLPIYPPETRGDSEMALLQRVPDYPNGWGAMGEVIDRLDKLGWWIERLTTWHGTGGWCSVILKAMGDRMVRTTASSTPLAICCAALFTKLEAAK